MSASALLPMGGQSLARLGGWLKKPFHRALDFDIATLDLTSYPATKPGPDLSARPIVASDLDAIEQVFGRSKRLVFEPRLELAEGLAVMKGTDMIGYVWGSTRELEGEGIPPFTFTIRPGPGMVYLYDGFILPEHRRHGGLSLVMSCALAEHQDRGLKTAFFLYNARQESMRRYTAKAGFNVAGRISYRRRLFFTHIDTKDLERITCG